MILGPVDHTQMAQWISAIPFGEWPQQHRLEDGKIRPSMVTDQFWHNFGGESHVVVRHVMAAHFLDGLDDDRMSYQRMLSVVMPGHSIPPHVDGQSKNWICRVHVPLLTNSKSWFWVEGRPISMEPGFAYRVDTTKEHAVTNDGDTPRIHFMFDVGKP